MQEPMVLLGAVLVLVSAAEYGMAQKIYLRTAETAIAIDHEAVLPEVKGRLHIFAFLYVCTLFVLLIYTIGDPSGFTLGPELMGILLVFEGLWTLGYHTSQLEKVQVQARTTKT